MKNALSLAALLAAACLFMLTLNYVFPGERAADKKPCAECCKDCCQAKDKECGDCLGVKEITAESLTIRSKDGDQKIVMQTYDDGRGAGIWICGREGTPSICLVSTASGQYLGLMPKKTDQGCSIAIAQDATGGPYIQVVTPDGKIRMIGSKKLLTLAD